MQSGSMLNILNSTIYESSVVKSLLVAIWNDGRGLAVANRYSDMNYSSRIFSEEDEPNIFRAAQNHLKKSGWKEILPDSSFSTNFTEIQIDILIHLCVPAGKQFVFREDFKCFNSRSPSDFINTLLKRPISLNGIKEFDPIPNSYLVVEVTLDSLRFREKILQIERDLTVLYFRQLERDHNQELKIDQIVSFAGIATNHLQMKSVIKFIEENKHALPMVFKLYELGRFFYFRHGADVKEFVHSVSHSSSVIDDLERRVQVNNGSDFCEITKDEVLLDAKIKVEQAKKTQIELDSLLKLHSFFKESGMEHELSVINGKIIELSKKLL